MQISSLWPLRASRSLCWRVLRSWRCARCTQAAPNLHRDLGMPLPHLHNWARPCSAGQGSGADSRQCCVLCAACCMQVACCLLRVGCCMVHVVCAQVTISGQLDGRALAVWLVEKFETGQWSALQTRCARVQRAAWCIILQDGVLHCNSVLQQNTLCCSTVY